MSGSSNGRRLRRTFLFIYGRLRTTWGNNPRQLQTAIIYNHKSQTCGSGDVEKIKEYTKKLLFKENEEAILAMCGSDLSYAEIGKNIYLSQRTVENYVTKMCEKLNIRSRAGLAVFAQYVGIGGFKQC